MRSLAPTAYVDVARMVAMEFVYMTAALGRLDAAARVLTYLDTTGDFGVLARSTLLADAVESIAPDPDRTDNGTQLDPRQALTYMRGVLNPLAGDPQTSHNPARPSSAGRSETGAEAVLGTIRLTVTEARPDSGLTG